MSALQWATSYDKSLKCKYEKAVRYAYQDAITEQIFQHKTRLNDEGVRIWEPSNVPSRLSKIHYFATFLIPSKREFIFDDVINHLSVYGKKQCRKERNRYRIIQNAIHENAKKW